MKMMKLMMLIVVTTLLVTATVTLSFAIPIPVDSSWNTRDVTLSSTVATLSDQSGWAYLYKGCGASGGVRTVAFDYRTSINEVSGGTFSDLFSVSIYLGSYDPYDPATWSNPVALLDRNAQYLTLYNGSVNDLGDGWSRFTFSFTDAANAVLDFELFDENQILGDGIAAVRNIDLGTASAITVPEPSTLVLWAAGLVVAWVVTSRRRLGLS